MQSPIYLAKLYEEKQQPARRLPTTGEESDEKSLDCLERKSGRARHRSLDLVWSCFHTRHWSSCHNALNVAGVEIHVCGDTMSEVKQSASCLSQHRVGKQQPAYTTLAVHYQFISLAKVQEEVVVFRLVQIGLSIVHWSGTQQLCWSQKWLHGCVYGEYNKGLRTQPWGAPMLRMRWVRPLSLPGMPIRKSRIMQSCTVCLLTLATVLIVANSANLLQDLSLVTLSLAISAVNLH